MIGRIAGILLEKNPPHLLVDCNGIGYEVDVPMSTFYNLPSTGDKVVLLTQLIVREDAHLLYGFGTAQAVAVADEPMASLYRGDRPDPRISDNVVSLR